MRVPWLDRFRSSKLPSEPEVEATTVVQIDVSSLSRVFSAPIWLRDLGLLAWFLVGVAVVLVGLVWILGLTSTIVDPVAAGAILATVAGPLVTWFERRRIPRPAGAAIVLLLLLSVGVLVLALVVGGIVEQSSQIRAAASHALDTIEGWFNDAGANGTSSTKRDVSQAVPSIGKTLLTGVAQGIQGLTSLVFFLTFTVFSTFFLLKDGPGVRAFVNRNLGVPAPVANTITGNVVRSLRRYFLGVTFVALFNAVVVGLGALALSVPLAGTIAVVVFVTAYVPFIGAFVSGAFAVVLTLAAQGTRDAVIMLVIVILANGLLQNIFQPIAFGATLDLNPLVVLIVTIGFGSLFGMIGLLLAAPLTSAALHISRELAQAKVEEAERDAAAGRAPPEPGPLFTPPASA